MTQAGRTLLAALSVVATLAVASCGSDPNRYEGQSRISEGRDPGPGLFMGLFERNRNDNANSEAPAGIGVNSFLWRASLDTLNFMPLQSADPFGGVIITDWYADPSVPNERFKATVYILDVNLRADALNVSIFRQVQANGAWADAPVSEDTESQIENAILQRARQLRLGQAPS
ncbi:MAG: DUF3576 domain-containing protein [Hyphomonadaceae bacterium]|nr:DUF3576 domain-containing protein [Hyphomonadaceae bacterium]